ncbi:TetR/AcrR family transcriptional regulator [Desulfobacula toluolica]|uniref:Transcriptional regulator, TetR family n=1 Tax=Desulfobacula toluolica (strain DSM 7467 / Tol2) TaxID=651182 RepID=K0NCI6_DESTT|nr:CerR family C-terminal domain-containing protein [Desulfobacula toluolica]CCK78385.1 transcriptional regulator, TetR family [Desulfobacula toluolica Tol2]
MPKSKSKNTQKELFEAGIKVFAKKGYRDATVREICKKAGAANINAVNYYFGSKEKLYREILDAIFSAYDRFDQEDWDRKTPREQLRSMISNFCAMLYKNNAFASDITSIFISEMTRPSPFIKELVDTYNRPRIKRHIKMFRDLLGEDATDDMARDCLVSVAGQLLYYSFAWPVFSRLFPDYSADERYEQWAAHVYEFSLGGIEAVRNNIFKKKENTHGN